MSKDKFAEFSIAQAIGALDSTGVVSTNVLDMELDASSGSTIIENDQIVGYFNVEVAALAGQVGATSGLDVILRQGDNADMTTGDIEIARVHFSLAELVSGSKKSVWVHEALTTKFVGVWHAATSQTLTTGNLVDAWIGDAPISENEDVQKIPS